MCGLARRQLRAAVRVAERSWAFSCAWSVNFAKPTRPSWLADHGHAPRPSRRRRRGPLTVVGVTLRAVPDEPGLRPRSVEVLQW